MNEYQYMLLRQRPDNHGYASVWRFATEEEAHACAVNFLTSDATSGPFHIAKLVAEVSAAPVKTVTVRFEK